MSRGVVDEEAIAAIGRAAGDASKRGLRIVGVRSTRIGDRRLFAFDLEPVGRQKRGKETPQAPDPSEPPPPAPLRRGGIPQPQGELF